MAEPIVNPQLPFIGEVPSGLQPGKMIRFQGVTLPDSDRFNINFATGPNSKPRDDTALHVSVRLNQGYIARNSYKDGSWGNEQGSGKLPIGQAQSFEMIILVDPHHYKIAVNGQHFCEFPHRIPYQEVTHLLIDGDVTLTLISFEGIVLGSETATQVSNVNAEGPQGGPPPQYGGPQYGPPPGAYGPPPPNYGGYGPPPPPGAQPQSEFGGFFEKAQEILAGAIASGAAEKIMSSIMPSGGQSNQPQGYAHQNARYGIYPDLPTQDSSQVPPQNRGQLNPQDSTLSNLIAGSGGTVTTGPQPTLPSGGQAVANEEQSPGPFGSLLMGLLGGNGTDNRGNQNAGGYGQPQNAQSGGSDVLSGILSSLLSGQGQSGQGHPQASGQLPPQNTQGQSVDFASILSGLLSSNGQQGASQPPINPQNQSSTPAQSQGGDVLSGLLSNLLSGQGQQNTPTHNQTQPTSQNQSGPDIMNILQGLISSSNQQAPGSAQPPNVPPQNYSQAQSNQTGQTGGNNAAMLTNLLQGLLLKAKEQQDSTRPIQETNPTGGGQAPGANQANPQNPQQYGQYPHPPPQQQEHGPMESLLSGLLSGGHQQQQSHGPQIGGDNSVGGLGSVGGILGSLAGSLLHRQDHQ